MLQTLGFTKTTAYCSIGIFRSIVNVIVWSQLPDLNERIDNTKIPDFTKEVKMWNIFNTIF